MRFLVVVTGWNCKDYVKRCLDSILAQDYPCIVSVMDDGSTDGTWDAIIGLAQTHGWQAHRFDRNRGTIYARHQAVLVVREEWDVLVTVDMDDELRPGALARVAEEYEKGKWTTYGTWINQRGKIFTDLDFDEDTHANRDYRKVRWRSTHLRTMKRELYFAAFPKEILPCEVKSYPDAEIMFACMEMCGKERIGVIREPIYLYNDNNPNNTLNRFGKDHKGYELITERPKRELWS